MIRLMHISIQFDDLHEQTTADFLRKNPNTGIMGRRGRRLPVAIALRFDRVRRREPPPTDFRRKTRTVGFYDSSDVYLDMAR